MWILNKTTGQSLYLFCDTTVSIGRKDCDALIDDDKSISRKHVEIIVGPFPQDKITDISFRPTIKVKDFSKYGTTVNGKKLDANSTAELHHGDILTLGIYETKYTVTWQPLVFCLSRIGTSDRKEVESLVTKIGAHAVTALSPHCTHILATEAGATEKVLLALLAGLPIVCLSFVKAVAARTSVLTPLPLESLHLARKSDNWPISSAEEAEPDFAPNPLRKTLFKGKQFVFLNKNQYERGRTVIQQGKGEAVDASEIPIDSAFFERFQKSVLIDPLEEIDEEASSMNPSDRELINKAKKLQEMGFQFVANQELAFAISAASCSVYCNPTPPPTLPAPPQVQVKLEKFSQLSPPTPLPTNSASSAAAPVLVTSRSSSPVEIPAPAPIRVKPEPQPSQLPAITNNTNSQPQSRSGGAEMEIDQQTPIGNNSAPLAPTPTPIVKTEQGVAGGAARQTPLDDESGVAPPPTFNEPVIQVFVPLVSMRAPQQNNECEQRQQEEDGKFNAKRFRKTSVTCTKMNLVAVAAVNLNAEATLDMGDTSDEDDRELLSANVAAKSRSKNALTTSGPGSAASAAKSLTTTSSATNKRPASAVFDLPAGTAAKSKTTKAPEPPKKKQSKLTFLSGD